MRVTRLMFGSIIVGRWPGWRWTRIRRWLLLRLAHQHVQSEYPNEFGDLRSDYGSINVKPAKRGALDVTVTLLPPPEEEE